MCICERIKHIFLIEERKIVVKVLKAQAESESRISEVLLNNKKIKRLVLFKKKKAGVEVVFVKVG